MTEPIRIEQQLTEYLLKNKNGLDEKEIIKKFQTSKRTLGRAIKNMQDRGTNVVITNGVYTICKDALFEENVIQKEWNEERTIRFGVVSDTHIGSKEQQISHLHNHYDIFEEEGIFTVYHAGDLAEGIKMRPGHEHEIFLHGSDDVEDYIIKHYPKRDGITTEFILGNHDQAFIKHCGCNIGKGIAKDRPDMKYLGMLNAKIYITPFCSLELNHPLDGSAYALSYSIQKMADSFSGGEKPNILLNGHHHKAMYLFYRNIHLFEAGCFQSQTSWMKGKRLAAHAGSWIIEVKVTNTGEISRCTSTFLPIYKTIKNDY